MGVCECLGKLGNLLVVLEYLLNLGRNIGKFINYALTLLGRYGSLLLAMLRASSNRVST